MFLLIYGALRERLFSSSSTCWCSLTTHCRFALTSGPGQILRLYFIFWSDNIKDGYRLPAGPALS